ncbi:hypothetical protein [Parablautia intestinalis]|uniref:hypothetical protein n=1 Tax=Parablautia intestinalis TaxID=2320100 RepID=UPI0023BB5F4C|nr:hypothetical protein [Parablautia intestinalis]MDE6388950.1 hypothetical protein [Lachnospiraceae bacterium]
MDDYISRKEHEAFADLMRSENKRLEDENNRQNKRLAEVETKVGELIDISTSIKSMTVEIKNLTNQIAKMDSRVEVMESRDGEMWRKVTGYIITAIIGIVIGFIFTRIGM